jgi:hypothetical protein
MPAQILHIVMAEEALLAAADALGGVERVRSWNEDFGSAFRLGAQGPDLFYHNQRSRPVAIEYGTLLHRRGFGSFAAALLRLTLTARSTAVQPTRAAAYALGFASHAFLDRSLHPYIVSKAGYVAPTRPESARYARCHAFFERILDALMLKRLRGLDVRDWDQDHYLTAACLEPDPGILASLEAALRDTFPERAGGDEKLPKRLANAFRDAAGFYRVTNPLRTSMDDRLRDGGEYLSAAAGRAAVALVYPEGLDESLDFLNVAGAPWRHPGRSADAADAYERSTAPELYARAEAAAADFYRTLFSHFMRTGRVPDEAASAVGDGGLSIVDASGAPIAPLGSDPLALDAVLDDQYRRRLEWLGRKPEARGGVD